MYGIIDLQLACNPMRRAVRLGNEAYVDTIMWSKNGALMHSFWSALCNAVPIVAPPLPNKSPKTKYMLSQVLHHGAIHICHCTTTSNKVRIHPQYTISWLPYERTICRVQRCSQGDPSAAAVHDSYRTILLSLHHVTELRIDLRSVRLFARLTWAIFIDIIHTPSSPLIARSTQHAAACFDTVEGPF